jgi:P-type Cu+ transporter
MDPATPLLALSKAVASSRSGRPFPACLLLRRCLPAPALLRRGSHFVASTSTPRRLAVPGDLLLLSLARLTLRGPGTRSAAVPRRWFASLSAASPLASGGPPGGGGGAGNGDGGGGDGADGWKRPRASQGAGVVEEAAGPEADAIVLDVGVCLLSLRADQLSFLIRIVNKRSDP